MASAFKRIQKRQADQDLHEKDLSHDEDATTKVTNQNAFIGSDNDSDLDLEKVPKSNKVDDVSITTV